MLTAFAELEAPDAWPAPRSRPRPARLERGVETLEGVGQTVQKRLARLGLDTVRDLLEHRPRRYEEAVDEVPIGTLHGEDEVAVAGEVRRASVRRARRVTILKAVVADATGHVTAVWFNQPWLAERLVPGTRVRL